MANAADLVTATIAALHEFRSDSAWNRLFKYVEDVAALPEICVTPQRLQRSRQLARTLCSWADRLFVQDSICKNTISNSRNLKGCTCKRMPVASTAFGLSSPSTTGCRVAIVEPNVLQTASTAKYLQAQRAYI